MSPVAKNIGRIHANIFAGLLERAQLQVKLALGQRLDKDLAALEDKYDGREASDLEQKVNKLSDRKEALALKVGVLKKNLKEFNDLRESLDDMRGHADSGFGPSFDAVIASLNIAAGSAVLYDDNLIGNPGTGVASQPDVVQMGPVTTTIEKTFLGTDYYITLADGTLMRPDHDAGTLEGIDFASLTLNSLVGDVIQFSDGVTTYDGTLTRTGSGVLSAWLYNNFATQADIDQGKSDVNDAMQRIDATETAFRRNLALIEAGISSVGSEMTSATEAYKAQTLEDLDAKQAERKALTTRFDLTVNSLSLIASINIQYVLNLFAADDPNEKQSVFDVLTGPIA